MEYTNVEDLQSRIAAMDANKVDIYPITTELQYVGTEAMNTFGYLQWDRPDDGTMGERVYLRFTSASRGRFFRELGGPDKYLSRTCDIPMQESNLDYLWGLYCDDHHKVLVRTRREEIGNDRELVIRAVMSEGYTVFDNRQFVDVIGPALDRYEMKIGHVTLDDEIMHVRAYRPDKTLRIGGASYTPGISFVNSEIGLYQTTVNAIIDGAQETCWMRWPVNGGAIVEMSRNESLADLAMQIERAPAILDEELEDIEAAMQHAATTGVTGDYTLRFHLMLRGAKINDDGRKLQDLVHLMTFIMGDRETPTRMDMVRAMGKVAASTGNQKMARLAGDMLRTENVWTGTILE